MTKENKILINRYLENSLTGIELKEFLDKLESDDNFRKEVSFYNLLIEGIQHAESKRQISSIEKFIGYRKSSIPFGLKLIFTFFITTIGGIILWNYIDPRSTGQKHNYFSLDFFHKQKNDTTGIVLIGKSSFKNKKAEKNILPVKKENSNNEKVNSLTDTNTFNLNDNNEVFVKKDLLLISFSLKAIDLSSQSFKEENHESSIAKNTIDKLNPSAGLPESEPENNKNFNLEFWVSPVNYKGYKLIDDKLILFGIEEPDAVQLYSQKNKLWMKYGDDFFSLEYSDNFESLNKTSEIPSPLK